MAFIDVDEFLVIKDATVASLPKLLSEYTDYGALAAHWQGSTLAAYTGCFPEHDPENRHVKALVNMDFVYQIAGPHHFTYYEGKYAVNSAGEKVLGPVASRVITDRIVINHYVTKSLEDFQRKMARGSGMRNRKDMTFFQRVQLMATQQCTYAVHLGEQLQSPYK
ncbi:g6728 [Coccomyxa viridis]|uniref:G6728 protein n=1 Tax=Coccomyxa viridis TaxID=1274662 RepID=A0ABP1FYE3_9CHLO